MISGPYGFQARVLHWLKKSRRYQTKRMATTIKPDSGELPLRLEEGLKDPKVAEAFHLSEKLAFCDGTMDPRAARRAASAPKTKVTHRVRLRRS